MTVPRDHRGKAGATGNHPVRISGSSSRRVVRREERSTKHRPAHERAEASGRGCYGNALLSGKAVSVGGLVVQRVRKKRAADARNARVGSTRYELRTTRRAGEKGILDPLLWVF